MVGLFILAWILLAFLLFWSPVKALIKWLSKVIHYFLSRENPADSQDTGELHNSSSNSLKFFDYIFLLRVPIVSGFIFFSFPFIAQFKAPKFLQNLFVIDSGIQIILVIVFTTLTAIAIVSLIKSILISKDECLNQNEFFRYLRTILTFALFLPTWVSLFLNKEPDVKGIVFGVGIFISLLVLLGFQIYEYRRIIENRNIPILERVVTTYQRLTPKVGKESSESQEELEFKRSLYIAIEIIIGLLFYVGAIWFNWPKPNGTINLSDNLQAPTLLYALLIIWLMTLLLGVIFYFFDKQNDSNSFRYNFRPPIILLLILFIASAYGGWQVDHHFQLKDSEVIITDYEKDFKTAIGNRLCPEDFEKEQSCQKQQSLVLVAASGGGIQASGWTAQVLAGLQDPKLGIGEDFIKAIGLISSTSGGSVGTMFYLNKFEGGILSKDGLAKNRDRDELATVVENATDDWLDSVGWGLAYPDLVRVIGLPFLTPKTLDRGYALEKDWQRTLKNPNLTLDNWYKEAKRGEIPIPVFNSTLVENGRRFLISPMKFIPGEIESYFYKLDESELSQEDKPKIRQSRALDLRTLYNYCGKEEEEKKPCTLALTTAARLSASFPYVSPMARNDIDNIIIDSKTHKPLIRDNEQVVQNYHMADGGFFDNAGAFTAIEWLTNFLEENAEDLNIKKIVLLQINAFPEVLLKPQQKGDKGLNAVVLGPLNALNGVRDSTQIARNIQAVELLKDSWNNNGKGISIKEFAISFPAKDRDCKDYNQPLSWRLTKRQKYNLKNAWETDPMIRHEINSIKAFWNTANIQVQVDDSTVNRPGTMVDRCEGR